MFFFEKKNQKTFATLVSELPAAPRPIRKSLLLLFFRKEDLPFSFRGAAYSDCGSRKNLTCLQIGVGADMRALLMCGALAVPAAAQAKPLDIGYHHPDVYHVFSGPAHDALLRARQAGTLEPLPSWSHAFSINGVAYNYTLLGTDPALGAATTTIPTVLVPVRLHAPGVMVNGHDLLLDATHIMKSVLDSPIFTPAVFDSGTLQFTDAMLHAEFQQAPADWHLIFAPKVGPTLDIVAPAGTVTAQISKSGNVLAIINDDKILDDPIFSEVRHRYSPYMYVIFVTYNATEHDALGYHADQISKDGTSATVYVYNSWLVGVQDLIGIGSPDADTFGHEMSETVHDALGSAGPWNGATGSTRTGASRITSKPATRWKTRLPRCRITRSM